MNMRKIQYIFSGIALMTLPLGIHAQQQAKDSTVNRTVVVEQEYNPDILDASKINVLPKVEPPTASKRVVEYDATLMPANAIPATVMQAYTGKETQAKAQPGYVRLGYGNYGNLDARANYLFTLSGKDRLNLNFHMNGRDGKLDLPENGGKWNSYYYRTHANIDYLHRFKKVDLNIAGNFGLSNFNFLPDAAVRKQKFTSGDIHFGVKSTDTELPLQFSAETNLMLYERQYDLGISDNQENIIRTKAQVAGSISEEQIIGIAFAMDNVFYKNNDFENYTSLNLNPYYRLENDDWKIRLGAQVDMAFGFGKKFRAAPDVSVEYNFSDSYILYAQAKGGKLQNDFRRLETFCPYGQITPQLDATYEQLNTAIGFKASPAAGLWLNLYGGYQNLKDDLFFQPTILTPAASEPYPMLSINQWNTSNFYAGAELRYDYKNIFSFSAAGVYRSWDTKDDSQPTGNYALAYKPAFEANLHIDVRPISSVLLSLGYQHVSREKVEESKVDAVNNLYLGGTYEFLKGISVYARINNLLNRDYQYYWAYPTEGINFIGGVSFKF